MTSSLHQQANALLYQALEHPAPDRPEFLAQACQGRRDLLELVNSMLSHIDQLDAFLEQPLAQTPANAAAPVLETQTQPGALLGRWRVVREIGRGHLGAFLLVEGSEGQIAALKILDEQAMSLEELALFHRQRKRLTSLTHPDLARVIDGGSLADGRPFFVVEYADGRPIDEYCEQAKLPPKARIALLVRVCQAVHHAHQRLVVHGHLHPLNILVTRHGQPKLAEYGIAGLLDQAAPAPFAAPEQQDGALVTTCADVYALGQVLKALFADVAEGLTGELAVVAAIACANDPAQRYPSADALARDLQHILVLQSKSAASATPSAPAAVRAAPASASASASAPASAAASARRRKRTAAVVAAGTLAVLAVGAVGVMRLKDKTGAPIAPMIQPAHAGVPSAPAAPSGDAAKLPLAEQLAAAQALDPQLDLRAALAAWESLVSELSTAGGAQALDARAQALEQLGELRRLAGNLEGARQSAQQLIALCEQQLLAASDEKVWDTRRSSALQADALAAAELGDAHALDSARKAVATLAHGHADADTIRIAAARVTLATVLVQTGDYAGAESEYRQAREAYAAQLADHKDVAAARASIEQIDLARANAFYLRKHGRPAGDTVRALRAAMTPATTPYLRARAALMEALIQPGGTAAQAFEQAQAALPEIIKETERDPANIAAKRESALAWRRAGEIGLRAGQKAAACALLGEAEKRYATYETVGRLNAFDQIERGQVVSLRSSCR